MKNNKKKFFYVNPFSCYNFMKLTDKISRKNCSQAIFKLAAPT